MSHTYQILNGGSILTSQATWHWRAACITCIIRSVLLTRHFVLILDARQRNWARKWPTVITVLFCGEWRLSTSAMVTIQLECCTHQKQKLHLHKGCMFCWERTIWLYINRIIKALITSDFSACVFTAYCLLHSIMWKCKYEVETIV